MPIHKKTLKSVSSSTITIDLTVQYAFHMHTKLGLKNLKKQTNKSRLNRVMLHV
jgi:hypothetical protein